MRSPVLQALRQPFLIATLLVACSSSGETPARDRSGSDHHAAPATPAAGEEADHAPAASTPTKAPASATPAGTTAPGADEEASAEQILVAHVRSSPKDPTVTRTREEALARATLLAKRIADGANFEELARTESDHRSKTRGGLIGTFKRSQLPEPAAAAAIYALAVGETSRVPVETQGGFHLFKRIAVQKIHARHILIRYHGAENDHGATRTKEEAAALAEDLRGRVSAPGADFAALAREYSDDQSRDQGGDLGEFGRGMTVAPFDDAVFRLAPNEISAVVESPFGYHVIQRLP